MQSYSRLWYGDTDTRHFCYVKQLHMMTLLGCALAKKKKKKICIVKSQPGFNATVEQFPLWVLPKENSRGLEGLLREKDSQLSSEIQAGPNDTVNASRLLKRSPPEFWLQWSTEQNTPTPARNGAVIRFYTPSAYQASGTFQVLATEESTKPPSPCSCGGSVSAFTDQGNSGGGGGSPLGTGHLGQISLIL